MAPSTLVCITLSNCSRVGGCVALARLQITPATYQAVSIFSPSSCQARPLTLATSATSSRRACAPSSRNCASAVSLRAVAMTRSPASMAWRASSRPIPREAAMIKVVLMVGLGCVLGGAAPGEAAR